MSTLDDKQLVAQLIQNEGRYPDDPQVAAIYSYRNPEGYLLGKIIYPGNEGIQVQELITSPFVRNPTLLWSQKTGITPAGKNWVETFKTL